MSKYQHLKRGGGPTGPDDVPRLGIVEISCIVIRFLTYEFLRDYWTARI